MKKVQIVTSNEVPVDFTTAGSANFSFTSGSLDVAIDGASYTGTSLNVADGRSVTASTTLSAVAANGNGSTVDFGRAMGNITVVTSTTGSPNAGTVTLQVSHDGTTWFTTTAVANVLATVTSATISNGAWRYCRGVLAALGGGTAPTVTATLMAI